MNLNQLKIHYLDGEITKEKYIQDMYQIHKTLFEYSKFLKDTDIKKIEISDDSILMTSRESDIKIICNPNDYRIIPIEILNFGFYEKEELDMVLKLVEKGFYFYDIGANIGWYSINIAKKVENIKIFAFEPIPITYNYLKKNIELNNLSQISTFNFGLSDEENEFIFYYYPEGSVNASLVNLSKRQSVEEVLCNVKKLDNFVQDKPVDFIKCDVEGAELLVFKGGLKSINKHKPIIFTELLRKWAFKFDYHPQDVVEILKDLGYSCYVIEGKNLIKIDRITEETVQTNFLFLHYEKHDKQIKELVL
ncbi:FkbM family methyltransferase [uncultured Methanobacterium sp.]|uniref:FkbM family methyltransferase n=1 Tax=uncultured Methanobacterium sp. TaxID=176306 RepID=UPI002AA8A4DC|nr:FkbM family methyltransferase [uncultured Methanobacterium sp.]